MDYSQRTGQTHSPLSDNRGPSRQRGGSYRSGRSSGGGSRYQLRSRNIRFRGRRSGVLTRFAGFNLRQIMMIVLGLVLAVLVIFLISSCVRSCKANTPASSDADSRVAAGVSDSLVADFGPALDQAEALQWIAIHANEYPNEDLPRLALREPAAIAFVRAYPEASKVGSAYGETMSRGEVPLLYNWDERWGAVDYDGSALAVTGSGPTVLSMAYIGLTGKTDKTPADLAALASDKGLSGGEAHTAAEFFTSAGKELGLDVHHYAPDSDTLIDVLDSGTVVLVEVRAETLTSETHWAIVAAENENGSVRVYDPTSVSVSSRPWDPATIASASTNMYAVSLAEAEAEAGE